MPRALPWLVPPTAAAPSTPSTAAPSPDPRPAPARARERDEDRAIAESPPFTPRALGELAGRRFERRNRRAAAPDQTLAGTAGDRDTREEVRPHAAARPAPEADHGEGEATDDGAVTAPSAQPGPDHEDAGEETIAGEGSVRGEQTAGASPPAPAFDDEDDQAAASSFYDAPVTDAELAEMLGDEEREPVALDREARLALIKERHQVYLARRRGDLVEDLCDTIERADDRPSVLDDVDEPVDGAAVDESGPAIDDDIQELALRAGGGNRT